MNEPRPYHEWRHEPDHRWRDALHTFGHLLMTHARDDALQKLPPTASDDAKAVAAKAVSDALYNVIMIVEGIVGAPGDDEHYLEFALLARVRDLKDDRVIEEFELGPDGRDSACMAFHDWKDGEFRQ